jgi:DNA-damage-inducible protein D
MAEKPDFDSIKRISPYGAQYWSARDLMPLLGYKRWDYFLKAVQDAIKNLQANHQITEDHISHVRKKVPLGSGAEREIDDYYLSRFACYLVAMNGDPRKAEIAAAQAYFAVSTRQFELSELLEAQEERLQLRERVAENNKALAWAASASGVLSRNFGTFQNRGYQGLYGGLDVGGIKVHKGIPQREDLLDRMGRAELAANDFRITQTEERLRKEGMIGESAAMTVHHEVGKKVRKAIAVS